MTLEQAERSGVEALLQELGDQLREGTYRSQAVLRRYIPKADGRTRPLGIPAVKDRIVQMATKLVLEPVFEAGFKDCSYGFRPKRNATEALEAVRTRALKGGDFVLDADIRDYFGSISHERLMERVSRRVSDGRVLDLLRMWLKSGVMDHGQESEMLSGTPQGGVISPLLANIYLDYLDTVWQERCREVGTLVRYADDFVVMCDSAAACEEAKRRVDTILTRLGLELHPEKTRRVSLTAGAEGFDFLGCHLRRRMSGVIWSRQKLRRYYLHRWPSQRSMKRLKERVRALTQRRQSAGRDIRDIISDLNPVVRGWGNYFRSGNAQEKFVQADTFVWNRLYRLMRSRHGRNLKPGMARKWTQEYFRGLGLHRLRGTIRYPGTSVAHSKEPLVSRVRENRTHGLKGGSTEISSRMKGK